MNQYLHLVAGTRLQEVCVGVEKLDLIIYLSSFYLLHLFSFVHYFSFSALWIILLNFKGIGKMGKDLCMYTCMLSNIKDCLFLVVF